MKPAPSLAVGLLTPRSSRHESLPVLDRSYERLDHLSVREVPVEPVQLLQPKIKPAVIARSLRWIIGIAAQVSDVLHEHKRAIEFRVVQVSVFRNLPKHLRARTQVARISRAPKQPNQRCPLI